MINRAVLIIFSSVLILISKIKGCLTFEILLLAYCSDKAGDGAVNTLQDTMSCIAGRPGRIASALCVAVYCLGTTLTFFILIGDQVSLILKISIFFYLLSLHPQLFSLIVYLSLSVEPTSKTIGT